MSNIVSSLTHASTVKLCHCTDKIYEWLKVLTLNLLHLSFMHCDNEEAQNPIHSCALCVIFMAKLLQYNLDNYYFILFISWAEQVGDGVQITCFGTIVWRIFRIWQWQKQSRGYLYLKTRSLSISPTSGLVLMFT